MTKKMISVLKTTTSIFIIVFFCASCGKSEVDLCVDAKLASWCSQIYGTDSTTKDFKSCVSSHLVIDGGNYREQCLRAESGR
jgi:hypothetical protein